MLHDSTDEELILRCRTGEEEAWKTLVDRYERMVFSIPRKMGLAEDDAVEVFNQTFTELWRSIDKIQEPGRISAWLGTVARRYCLAQIEHHRRFVRVDADEAPELRDLADPAPMADRAMLAAEREQAMRTAMAQLPLRCRRLLAWLFFLDPTPKYAEIGRRLGVARNSIGFVRGRCLEKLRRALEDESVV